MGTVCCAATEPTPEAGGANLRTQHAQLLAQLDETTDVVARAVGYFCAATYRQFYVDGNKRTARLMMNGTLMSSGFDAISIPARRRLEFNDHLRTMFTTAHANDLANFLLDCRPR